MGCNILECKQNWKVFHHTFFKPGNYAFWRTQEPLSFEVLLIPKKWPPGKPTELYRINRECHRFLGNEAESQQHFVAFAAPSSGQIWQIY